MIPVYYDKQDAKNFSLSYANLQRSNLKMQLEYTYTPDQVRIIPEGQSSVHPSLRQLIEQAENEYQEVKES